MTTGGRGALCSRACATIQTVTGSIRPDALGTTLMHEHLLDRVAGLGGGSRRRPARLAASTSHAASIACRSCKAHGAATLVDPCPIDLGRDVELMAEVAQASGVQIVCATGLYKEDEGAARVLQVPRSTGATRSAR